MPVVIQRQVPVIQQVQKTVEVPQGPVHRQDRGLASGDATPSAMTLST